MIRQEKTSDIAEIHALVQCAFAGAEHADGNEQDLVDALRRSSAYIPELSLVAEQRGKLIGHILFTKANVGDHTVLALAPLSVLPEFQCQGVGTTLIKQGHLIARNLGYDYSVVLGSAAYYSRFGYTPANAFGIFPPFEVRKENFMAHKLVKTAPEIHGIMQYAKEFGI